MTKRMLRIVTVASALGLWGCGSDSRTPGGPVAIEDVPRQLATTTCDKLDTCFAAYAGIFDVFLGDCDAQLEGQFADVALPRWQMAISMGTLVYHDDLFGSCLSQIRALGCSDLQSGRMPAACEAAIEGTVALGGACNIDEECAGAAYCNFTGSCPGACTMLAGEGMACDADDHCASGTICQGSTCARTAAHGAACGGGTAPECEAGLLCIGEDTSTMRTGTCRTSSEVFTVAEGGTCNFDTGLLCAGGLSCAVMGSGTSAMLTCQRSVGSGAACSFGIPDQCPNGEYCNADTSMMRFTGNCVRLPGEGLPCADRLFSDCASGLSCRSGTCRRTQRIGGACMTGSDCYSGNCSAMVCAAAGFCAGP